MLLDGRSAVSHSTSSCNPRMPRSAATRGRASSEHVPGPRARVGALPAHASYL